jgi:hypothetical protein
MNRTMKEGMMDTPRPAAVDFSSAEERRASRIRWRYIALTVTAIVIVVITLIWGDALATLPARIGIPGRYLAAVALVGMLCAGFAIRAITGLRRTAEMLRVVHDKASRGGDQALVDEVFQALSSSATDWATVMRDCEHWRALLEEHGTPVGGDSLEELFEARLRCVQKLRGRPAEIAGSLSGYTLFADLVDEHLRSVIGETEAAAADILGRLRATNDHVQDFVGFVRNSDLESKDSLAAAQSTLHKNTRLIEALHTYLVRRSAALEEQRATFEGFLETTRTLEQTLDSVSVIAGQTRMLALNATIEASRAGEAGRGFAIVALEIKNLSLKSDQSVKTIREAMEQVRASIGAHIERAANDREGAEEDRLLDNLNHDLVELGNSYQQMIDQHMRLLGGTDDHGRILSSDILAAIAEVQFQDIVTQQIGTVLKGLEGLRQYVDLLRQADEGDCSGSLALAMDALIEKLRSHYVVGTQHANDALISRHEVVEQDSCNIEFF